MRATIPVTLAVAFLFAASAAAQTRISGVLQCSAPQAQPPVEIGDRAGHTFSVVQIHCTWTKPLEIAGLKSGDDLTTGTEETLQNNYRGRGYDVVEWPGGARTVDRYYESGVVSGGNLVSSHGSWRFTAGTGRLSGIQGGGTYSCKPSGSGGATCDVEGDYSLPAK